MLPNIFGVCSLLASNKWLYPVEDGGYQVNEIRSLLREIRELLYSEASLESRIRADLTRVQSKLRLPAEEEVPTVLAQVAPITEDGLYWDLEDKKLDELLGSGLRVFYGRCRVAEGVSYRQNNQGSEGWILEVHSSGYTGGIFRIPHDRSRCNVFVEHFRAIRDFGSMISSLEKAGYYSGKLWLRCRLLNADGAEFPSRQGFPYRSSPKIQESELTLLDTKWDSSGDLNDIFLVAAGRLASALGLKEPPVG